jgi:hypothetical protein
MPRQQLYEYEGDRDYESYEIKALNGFAEKPWYIVRVYYFIPTETFEEEIVSPYFANKGSARRYAELHNIPLNKEIPVYSVYKNKTNTNMNKKQVRLTESDLKQIVKESVNKILNEAYGTTDRITQNDINVLRGKKDDRPKNRDASIIDAVESIEKSMHMAKYSLDNIPRFIGKWENGARYYTDKEPNEAAIMSISDAIRKNINKIYKLTYRLKNVLIMNQGEQPDETYFDDKYWEKNLHN